ncbi:MAG: helix-turn-helix domain-containing protein [Novosphingobium sp.]|nr:helix-turn-helix domain-containing protein [Novosphingobium sp.]
MPRPQTENLPNLVRHWRMKRGLSLRDLAARIGISHPCLGKIETGKQRLSQYWMEKIGRELNVMPADLMSPADGALTHQEREWIDTFRRVPEANQRMIIAAVESQRQFRVPRD